MVRRKLEYVDVTQMTDNEQQVLLKKMHAGHTVRTVRKEQKFVSRSEGWREVEVVDSKKFPPLEALWLQKVGGMVILFGYMRPEECPVPIMQDRPKGVRKPKPSNGGLIPEGEYNACRNRW